ncbi:unnamed protein product [Blepharisma stoltei]|uniref:Uncharacterized protein n=1 Tax=Blepharisma stoltei TaxID=1481888 RepID=A0AAU9K1Y0_9CILI|nr:unnamed protein product [Blepharisma stoltei]
MFEVPIVARSQSCFERIISSPLADIIEENYENECTQPKEEKAIIENLLREKEEDAHLIKMLKGYSFSLQKKIDSMKSAVNALNDECESLKNALTENDNNISIRSNGLFAKAIEARNRKASFSGNSSNENDI